MAGLQNFLRLEIVCGQLPPEAYHTAKSRILMEMWRCCLEGRAVIIPWGDGMVSRNFHHSMARPLIQQKFPLQILRREVWVAIHPLQLCQMVLFLHKWF